MNKRQLGSTGLEVTTVGFGGMTIGGAFGPVDDTRKRSLTPENLRKFQGQLDAVKAAAVELGVSPAELAIRFCASNPNVSCVIPGVRTVAQAEQNAAAAQPLPADVMQQLLER